MPRSMENRTTRLMKIGTLGGLIASFADIGNPTIIIEKEDHAGTLVIYQGEREFVRGLEKHEGTWVVMYDSGVIDEVRE